MDYEFRIKVLEQETAHLTAMKDIARERQDTTDNRLTKLEAISLENAETVKSLAESVLSLVGRMDQLIEAMTAQRRNGK